MGKKVRRFGDAKVDGKITFEEHERRTLPCSRLALCERFLTSDDYKAFLTRQKSVAEAAAAAAQAKAAATAAAAAINQPPAAAAKAAAAAAKAGAAAAKAAAVSAKAGKPLHLSFFQHRICSCIVEEKMTQCADSIDTQFNVLFKVWLKAMPGWFDDDTCDVDDCVCKELGFFEIETSKDLWAFLFRDECAPKPDPTRALAHDVGEHTQLAHDCVSNSCNEEGCMKDKLARWALCLVMNKVSCLGPLHARTPAQPPRSDEIR